MRQQPNLRYRANLIGFRKPGLVLLQVTHLTQKRHLHSTNQQTSTNMCCNMTHYTSLGQPFHLREHDRRIPPPARKYCHKLSLQLNRFSSIFSLFACLKVHNEKLELVTAQIWRRRRSHLEDRCTTDVSLLRVSVQILSNKPPLSLRGHSEEREIARINQPGLW